MIFELHFFTFDIAHCSTVNLDLPSVPTVPGLLLGAIKLSFDGILCSSTETDTGDGNVANCDSFLTANDTGGGR